MCLSCRFVISRRGPKKKKKRIEIADEVEVTEPEEDKEPSINDILKSGFSDPKQLNEYTLHFFGVLEIPYRAEKCTLFRVLESPIELKVYTFLGY